MKLRTNASRLLVMAKVALLYDKINLEFPMKVEDDGGYFYMYLIGEANVLEASRGYLTGNIYECIVLHSMDATREVMRLYKEDESVQKLLKEYFRYEKEN